MIIGFAVVKASAADDLLLANHRRTGQNAKMQQFELSLPLNFHWFQITP